METLDLSGVSSFLRSKCFGYLWLPAWVSAGRSASNAHTLLAPVTLFLMFRIQFFSCFLLPDIQAMFPLKPLSVTVCGNQYPRIGCKCGQGSFELLVRLVLCLGVEGVAPKRGSFTVLCGFYATVLRAPGFQDARGSFLVFNDLHSMATGKPRQPLNCGLSWAFGYRFAVTFLGT